MAPYIADAIRDSSGCSEFTALSIPDTAHILIRFGIESFDEQRPARADQGIHFTTDVEISYGFKSPNLLREMFDVYPPVLRGRNIASVELNEVHLQKNLLHFTADLSAIDGTIRPAQGVGNAASEEIDRWEANPHPLHRHITHNYHERPWLPRPTAHINALAEWKANNRGTRKRAIAFQIGLRHHYRFVFSAEIGVGWESFGGLTAKLNHIDVLLDPETMGAMDSRSDTMIFRYRRWLTTLERDCLWISPPPLRSTRRHTARRGPCCRPSYRTDLSGEIPSGRDRTKGNNGYDKGRKWKKGSGKGAAANRYAGQGAQPPPSNNTDPAPNPTA